MDIAVIEKIKKEIEHFSKDDTPVEGGIVLSVGDGVAEIEGLSGAFMAEVVRFEEGEGKTLKEEMEKALRTNFELGGRFGKSCHSW